MDNENMDTQTPAHDDEVMLPEGYKEGDNIFENTDELGGFGGEEENKDNSAAESSADPAENTDENPDSAAEDTPGDEKQQEQPPEVRPFRFRHGELDVELKESDIPDLYRKAQERDTMHQERDAANTKLHDMQKSMEDINVAVKGLGFTDVKAMVDKAQENFKTAEIRNLVEKGISEEEAKEIVDQRVEAKLRAQREEQAKQAAPARDFRREMSELVQHRPELREKLSNGGTFPQEVITASIRDKVSLREAYAEYEMKEAKAEAEKIRRENEILKQNAANAAKAPVKGTAGGGTTKQKSKDPFLEGFNS